MDVALNTSEKAVGTWVDRFGLADQFSPADTYTYTLTTASSAGNVTETVDVYISP